MLKKLIQATLLLSASALSMNASAGVISQTFWFGDDSTTTAVELAITDAGGTDIQALPLNWGPGAFSFDQFDTLGGTRTLDSVELILSGTSVGWIEGTNGGTNPADLTLELGTTLTVSGSGLDLVNVFPLYTETFTNVGPGDTVGSGPLNTAADKTETYFSTDTGLDAFIFNTFIGTGGYAVEIDALGYFNATGGGSGSVSRVNSSDGALEVVYNFTEATTVSEPTGIAVLGLALGLMGFAKRRRDAK